MTFSVNFLKENVKLPMLPLRNLLGKGPRGCVSLRFR